MTMPKGPTPYEQDPPWSDVPHKVVRVFLNVVAVLPREKYPVPLRYKAELIARGSGTVMYVSRTVDTREQAEALALRYLASARGSRLMNTSGTHNRCTLTIAPMPCLLPSGHRGECDPGEGSDVRTVGR